MSAELLYPLIGGSLSALGAALLLWALFRDRSRGRLRCPRCWYRMEGVPAIESAGRRLRTCPECGRACTGERQLRRTRRGKRRAAVALLLLVSGWGVWKYPAARARGLWSYAPTTVLIAVHKLAYEYGWGGSEVGSELLQRVYDGKVTSWQLAKIDPPGLDSIVSTGGRELVWPADELLAVQVTIPPWLERWPEPLALCVQAQLHDAPTIVCSLRSNDGRFSLADRAGDFDQPEPGRATRAEPLWFNGGGGWIYMPIFNVGLPPLGATDIIFDWKIVDFSDGDPKVRWTGQQRLAIRVVGRASGDVDIQPVRSPELDSAVRHGLVRGLERQDGLGPLGFRIGACGPALDGVSVSARLELRHGETVLGDACLFIGPDQHSDVAEPILFLSPPLSFLPGDPFDPAWNVRIRTDIAGILLRGFQPMYWDGDITIPLSEILAREVAPASSR
ncbi:MAG: hypothetical protein IT436_02380 [Phycisphaerales bacterium]|nr:hypothetical protein [Phycisphaerales bacterium]